jgi:hypothetical protein
MVAKNQHPNSLANLKTGGKNHEPVRHLASKIRDFDSDGKTPIFKILFGILHDAGESTKDRLHAAEILLNRGWGRSIETVVIEEVNPVDGLLKEYTVEELRALRSAMIVEADNSREEYGNEAGH